MSQQISDNVTIAILAGGQSSRMGRDKSFVELNGHPLIAHVIKQVSQLALPIMIIANQTEAYQPFNLPVFTDVLPTRSSLGGLYSALYHSPSDYTLCVACDMPYLNPGLLKYLVSVCRNYDAVVPVIGEYPQGLHAIYRKTCLTTLLQQIENDSLRLRDFYGLVNTCWITEDKLLQFDTDLKSFMNINTPDALRAAHNNPQSPTD